MFELVYLCTSVVSLKILVMVHGLRIEDVMSDRCLMMIGWVRWVRAVSGDGFAICVNSGRNEPQFIDVQRYHTKTS